MFSIIRKMDGLFLFSSKFDTTTEDNIAINKICDIENPESKEIYFNFVTQTFSLAE